MRYPSLFFTLILLFAACRQDLVPDSSQLAPLPQEVPERFDNPATPEKLELGKLLFFDPILSGPKTVSCATCHDPAKAFADGKELSRGVDLALRNSPTLINVAFNGLSVTEEYLDQSESPMFWDHRARSLEEQAIGPLLSAEEMRGDAYSEEDALDSLVARLRGIAEYVTLFEAAFPDAGVINPAQLSQALSVYQRSLIAPNTRFDQYLRGESDILNQEEVDGLNQFVVRGCVSCHSGPMLSDFKLHRLGVADHGSLTAPDRGNGQDQFRTPTLRNVTLTAPYMHNGTQATLEEVMQFYDDKQSLHPNVANSELAQEFLDLRGMSNRRRDQIIAFLRTLEGMPADVSPPARVPSGY
ncbi:MAG: cytochrome c peroxidase [Bacteroidota bacterium]